MRPALPSRVLAVLLAALLLVVPPLAQAAGGDMDADAVFGQADFTGRLANRGGAPNSNTLNAPTGAAVDPVSGALYVADYNNSRVLRYHQATVPARGDNAELVIGQPTFSANDCNKGQLTTNQSRLCGPGNVAVDAAGRLYVAEFGNHRVLRYDNPQLGNTDADAVFGQGSFTGDGTGNGLDRMNSPTGVAVDAAGNLYVADRDNYRVLRFANAGTAASGATADQVFGATGTCAPTATTLCFPSAVAVTGAGTLFVADQENHRVVAYLNATTRGNQPSADLVFGQADFTSGQCNRGAGIGGVTDQSRLCTPQGVAVDAAGRLYVADANNRRVLRYHPPFSGTGGNTDADWVFGQSLFTQNLCNKGQGTTNQSRLCTPTGMAFDGAGNLYVADTNNHRLLRYDAP